MTPGFSMAITGSTPSGAALPTTTAAGTGAAAPGEAAATPGDFLGMLGTLVQASAQALAQSAATPSAAPAADAAIAADAPANPLLTEVLAPLQAAITSPTEASAKPAGEETDSTTTPEAAASVAALLAQMWAGPPQVATAIPVAPPADSKPASVSAPVGASSPQQAATQAVATPSADAGPLVAGAASLVVAQTTPAANDDDATATEDAVSFAAKTATQDKTAARPLAAPLQSATKDPSLDGFLALAGGQSASKEGGSADDSGFRSLASLLAATPPRADTGRVTTAATDLPAQPLAMTQPAAVAQGDAANPDVAQQVLREPVGTAKWADALGARLTMMATRGEQHGSLRLSPEHLGPLEVQIRVQDDRASVWFGAQHADTRAALQDALPRLRELFAASGMQLGDAGVSREAPRQERAPADAFAGTGSGSGGDALTVEEALVSVAPISIPHSGLVDTYA